MMFAAAVEASLWSGYALPTRRPIAAIDGDSGQGNHLSEPKRCSDKPGHLGIPAFTIRGSLDLGDRHTVLAARIIDAPGVPSPLRCRAEAQPFSPLPPAPHPQWPGIHIVPCQCAGIHSRPCGA
jgi:hypothetical protein